MASRHLNSYIQEVLLAPKSSQSQKSYLAYLTASDFSSLAAWDRLRC